MSNKKNNEKQYGADQIQILEGLEAVRKRPGMYIGSTSVRGLHHLVWEIVDNSIDEHLAGHANNIKVVIHKDDSISVEDDGRGIPVDMHEKMGIPAVEVILTILHAGGKFGGEGSGYKVSGGLHGVGASVTNALSTEMVATIKRDGKLHEISFSRGKKTADLHVVGTCDPEETGTKIWFKPDPEIFKETTEYDYKTVFNRMRESAFLNKGLSITVVDERELNIETGNPISNTLYYEKGIVEYVAYVNHNKKPYHEEIFYMNDRLDDVDVEIALQYHDGDTKDGIYSFTNNIKTPEGGTHEAGFKTALTNSVKTYIQAHDLMKGKKELPNGDDTRTGLTAIVTVKVPEPQFEGQTKSKLGNSEVSPIVNQLASHHLTKFFEENPDVASIIIDRIIQTCELRIRMKAARDAEKKKMKTRSSTTSNPEKLSPCESRDKDLIELFLVEGDSAGGSAKQGRDKSYQAILSLRGKVINTEKADILKIAANKEIDDMGLAIGTGYGDDFDIEKRRYNKIVLMTDADVDGDHIKILLLTFFFRHMRPLVEQGFIYIAQPPLFKIQHGKKVAYAYSIKDRDEKIASLFPDVKPNVQRYKGLGEMDATQLWETTMDPSVRTLLQVSVDDAALAEVMFTDLMGDDAAPRKTYIQDNALFASLDI